MTANQELEARVEEETERRLRFLNHKQAHERLGDVRSKLKGIRLLVDEPLAEEIQHFIVNDLENWMGRAEQVVRSEPKA